MSEWRWVSRDVIVLLHEESLAEHGGAAGLRDSGLLDSALTRPAHLAAYGSPDLAEMAATLGVGLAKNHPFVDGNKRAAFLATGLFALLNGQRLVVSQAEATFAMLGVASGEWSEARFADWLRSHLQPRDASRN